MIDDETLMAFADGELDAARADEVAAAVAADPALAAAVARHRRARAALAEAFAPVAEEPVPARLLAALRGTAQSAEVVDFAAARAARRPALGGRLPHWAALAATLAVGVIAGRAVELRPAAPIASANGEMRAGSQLAAALETQLASDPAPGPVRIGLSFRQAGGGYCRTFRMAEGDGVAGIACRDGGGWGVRMAVAAGPLQGGDYRMAASDTPPAVLAGVGAMIDGQALDARQETAAREGGWR